MLFLVTKLTFSFKAMSDMEFDKFVKPLENSLDLWKQGQQMKKESAAKRKKDAEKGSNSENARLVFWSL